jgi:hypothetical protein
MPQDRVGTVLRAYFSKPYDEYGELALEIRSGGGLTPDEARIIENSVLSVDATTIIRQIGCPNKSKQIQASASDLCATKGN